MKKSWIIAKRELKAMLRERTVMLVVLVELLLVIFSGLLNVGYVLLTTPEASAELQNLNSFVAVGIISNTPEKFALSLFSSKMPYVVYDDVDEAFADFREGMIDVIFIGDIEKSENASQIVVYIPENSPKKDLIKLSLRNILLKLEKEIRAERIVEYKPDIKLYSVDSKSGKASREIEIYYIFTIPLLLFLPSLIAGSLVIDSITEDLENKTIINLMEAPLKGFQIVLGKNLGAIIICMAQSVAWVFILSFLSLGIQNHMSLIFISFLYTVIFTNIGSFVSLRLKNLRNSQVVHTGVSMASISLFSPLANLSNQLVANSPSYIFTGLASGATLFDFRYQVLLLLMVFLVTGMINLKSAVELENLYD
ncbi:MAG: ABC transporter permease [Candidatus Altiarchaeota archaeon]